MFNLPHVETPSVMAAHFFSMAAATAFALAPLASVNAREGEEIVICTARGPIFAPFISETGNAPQNHDNNGCHVACLGDRSKTLQKRTTR